MPPEARRRAADSRKAAEIAAGSMKAIPRSDTVTLLAAHYETRDAYLVAAGPGQVPSTLARLAPITEAAAYLDKGDEETVMTVTGPALELMPDLLEAEPAEVAAVWVIPKTVPAARLGKALGSDIPADGTRDLIMLTLDDGKHMAYPMILVAAIERVDPAAAAGIRTGERDLVLSHMSPRTRALADQADAAGAHAARIFTEMAAANGGTPTFQALPSLVREVAERFPRRAAAGQIDLCAHLSPAAPEPAFWCASDPGWLRCGGCLGDATDSIRGTEEDQRCDYCRRVSDRIHNEAGLMPPIVAELPGMLAASGPVMLMFGLCPDCHAEAFPDGSAAG